MTRHEEMLSSEIRQLEQMLDGTSEGAVIQRISLESRLKAARDALALARQSPRPSRAQLTFRGRPVLGSHGIAADFGGRASSAFADAFAAVVAGLNENLQFMGPIPDRTKNQLLITGTAIGSFGFEFEIPVDGLFPEQDKTEEALQKMQSLLEVSATGTDDDVAELVDAIHPRAVKKLSEFLTLLSQHQAWCGVEFQNKVFQFEDLNQLEKSAGRLDEKNIKETRKTYRGEFVGVLPNSRTFEFQSTEGLIKGKVGAQIEDPDLINREWLKRSTTIMLDVVQVGQGRPRYALNVFPSR